MKKIFISIGFVCLFALLLTGCSQTNSNEKKNTNDHQNNVNLSKVSTEQNISAPHDTNSSNESGKDDESESDSSHNTDASDPTTDEKKTSREETISEFSTKIYDKKAERQHNVTITCQSLNETVVKKGETFSFTSTIGKATPSKGYEKAKIFDKAGNVEEGYGGGICQVSTTVYNAVKDISGITVTERHDHSNKVPYAKKGNDAAVAHGSYDFKFVNHTEHDIVIHAENSKSKITVTINRLIE